jgi:demethylmenaquinone methyltransferase/2-methoxy-6-polyprenyl-1,4-benzoquinol methylase
MSKKPLHDIFSDIPRHYDIINHIVTLGLDIRWRNALARKCLKNDPKKVLDLCCGTGDLVLTVAKFAMKDIALFGLDFSANMLDIARQKAAKRYIESINFTLGDAGDMPFEDETFDSIGISFGFRNLTYSNPASSKHLSEILRVLKKGGHFVIAETSQPQSRFVRFFFHLYMKAFVKPVGMMISGNKPAYRYFSKSTCEYFDRNQLKELLLGAGFESVDYKPMLLGASSLVVAVK